MQAQDVAALLAELHREYLWECAKSSMAWGVKAQAKMGVTRVCHVQQRTLQERVQVVLHELEGCANIAEALPLHSRSQHWVHSKPILQSHTILTMLCRDLYLPSCAHSAVVFYQCEVCYGLTSREAKATYSEGAWYTLPSRI